MQPVQETPDSDLVQSLLRDQAPDLAHLPSRLTTEHGSSNWVYRLGDELAVRLPRSDDYADDLIKEVRWLPALGPSLPLPVPEIVFAGEPSLSFRRPWAVVTWIPGETPGDLTAEQQRRLAQSLGSFTQALHALDTAGQPHGAEHWGYRAGEPVTEQSDRWLDNVANDLQDLFDPAKVREAWRRLRDVPPASTPPCWTHTDLSAENLLIHPTGDLAGVVDFGGLGIGDRSVDFLYAWSLFDEQSRTLLRQVANVDESIWLRARAWAFVGPGLLTIAGYRDTMPKRTRRLIRMVQAVAAEVGVALG